MSTTFKELGLLKPVLDAITELGFETPTPIQEKVIPTLLSDSCDIVALAQTGTGKTAAFGLPLVSLIDFAERRPVALVLAPTRELCMQITSDLKNFSKNIHGSNIVAVYGGASIRGQVDDLRRGAQIVVATPGRMVDIINRGAVDLQNIKYVVLDEADEMLNMGFKEDLDFILSSASDTKNTWLFSATMPNEVLAISRNYMKDPIEVTAGIKNMANENIEHMYYVTQERERYNVLKRIADFYPDIFALVFCRTKIETQRVADKLIKDGYNADALHGDLSQAQRDHVMKRFRGRTLQLLVATDVAARGIDVNDITHVIHFNLPDEIENYTHRSGRTARAGKTGMSIAIINTRDQYKIKTLEKLTNKKFTRAEIPTGFQICEKQLFHLVQGLDNAKVNEEEIKEYLPNIMQQLEHLSKEEIIKRFVSIEFNRFLDYYRNAPDLNSGGSSTMDEYSGRETPPGVVKLFLSVGKMDGFGNDSLKKYLSETTNVPAEDLTWVDIKNSFSFIEVKNEMKDQLMNGLDGATYRGRPVKIESRGNREEGVPRERSRSYGGGRSGGGRSSDTRFEKGWGSEGGSSRGGDRRSSGGGDRRGGGGFDRRSSGGGERRSSGGFDRRSSGGSSDYKPRERSSGSDFKPRERSSGGSDYKPRERSGDFKPRERNGGDSAFKPRERSSGSDYKPRERKSGGAFERKVGSGGDHRSDAFKKRSAESKPHTPPTRPASGMNRAERRKAKFGSGEAPKGDS
ncbi:MAG TPA: DEAD/DEAH box helicase [Bacteroidia bacterium]|nr:DEAD/DEAH box helicase [Bacteroidia bacterium]